MVSLSKVDSPLNVRLEQYEGPLDLLLDLIRKQKIDIYDIPIARITAQYLEYLERAAELNIDLGAEFIYMAATLIHIKSRMLLPRDPELVEEGEPEDPRAELVQRLLEYERFKQAAEMLQERLQIEEAIWTRPRIQEFLGELDGPELSVTLFDLVKTFQEVLERARHRPPYGIEREEVSVGSMIQWLRQELCRHPERERLRLRELLLLQPSRRAMICLFLAILELVRLQALRVSQKDVFGEIYLERGKAFDSLQAGTLELAPGTLDYA